MVSISALNVLFNSVISKTITLINSHWLFKKDVPNLVTITFSRDKLQVCPH